MQSKKSKYLSYMCKKHGKFLVLILIVTVINLQIRYLGCISTQASTQHLKQSKYPYPAISRQENYYDKKIEKIEEQSENSYTVTSDAYTVTSDAYTVTEQVDYDKKIERIEEQSKNTYAVTSRNLQENNSDQKIARIEEQSENAYTVTLMQQNEAEQKIEIIEEQSKNTYTVSSTQINDSDQKIEIIEDQIKNEYTVAEQNESDHKIERNEEQSKNAYTVHSRQQNDSNQKIERIEEQSKNESVSVTEQNDSDQKIERNEKQSKNAYTVPSRQQHDSDQKIERNEEQSKNPVISEQKHDTDQKIERIEEQNKNESVSVTEQNDSDQKIERNEEQSKNAHTVPSRQQNDSDQKIQRIEEQSKISEEYTVTPRQQNDSDKKMEIIEEQTKEKSNNLKSHKSTSKPKPNLTEECEYGYFKIKPMNKCRKWLNCKQIKQSVTILQKIGGGIGKEAFITKLEDDNVTLVMLKTRLGRLKDEWITDRVEEGLENLIHFQTSPYVNKLAGFCRNGSETVILSENCAKYGDLESFVESKFFTTLELNQRFQLVMDVIKGFVELHNDDIGPRVHCDLHETKQALGQYLVTDELKVVLNDIDEIPIHDPSKNKIARCRYLQGCKTSAFLAPEQQYTYEYCKSKWKSSYPGMKRATPKSDVWKIPDMAEEVLKLSTNHKELKEKLAQVYAHCREIDESKRWSSNQVSIAFEQIYDQYFNNNVL